ncbi:alpha/beta hydrolase [Nonomuraea candida]|uniref:alpha/beta hydrolase n=1 Tax=Nonomuraea candida TaxID=359159 RepID=UPI0005B7A476|nr:alpha/beta hydrolase [Nonomuraea candida]
MIRRVTRIALSVVVAAGLLWWGYTALLAPPEAAVQVRPPAWARCPGTLDVECASIEVPVDHAAPGGARIDLALARLPVRYPERRLGSLVVNYGGPGVSGVETLIADQETFNPLRARYDIVAFDPRGVGKSAPVDCSPGGGRAPYLALDQTPDTEAELQALLAARDEHAAACERRHGGLLAHLSTEATAHDLDLLRAALGDDRLSYLGYSYGGGLGAVYSWHYPGRVGRMVLDAPMPVGGPGEPKVDGSRASDLAIKTFAEDCVRRPDCPLGSRELDVALAKLRDLVQDLDRRPLKVTGGTLDDTGAAAGIFNLLYSTDSWQSLRGALAGVLHGDGQALYDAAAMEGQDGAYGDAALVIGCNDNPSRPEPGSLHEQARIARQYAPVTGAWQVWTNLRCQGWQPREGAVWPDEAPAQLPPIMVVGTTGDPVVTYGEVQTVRDALPDSVLVSVPGNTHTTYGSADRCANETMRAYLLDGVVPAADVECPAAGASKG